MSSKIAVSGVVAGLVLLSAAASPVKAQQVYYGCADQWSDLLKNPGQWTFVRQNADGFYINFIELEPSFTKDRPGILRATAALFTHKNAYFESDMAADGQSLAFDRRDIDNLQQAGFTVPYTSLNYGWSQERFQNLKFYHLLPGQSVRYSFVQQGPWAINGSLLREGGPPQFTNAQYRNWTTQADGVSTDGPLGFWFSDQGQMRSGSFSMVDYAHSQKKLAVVMLAPYAAGVAAYDPGKMFLSTAEDCVRKHEDNDSEPDIYDVFEYATTIGAVPEQIDGAPVQNSTTAVAYYLIKHIHGDPGTLTLSIQSLGTLNGISIEPAKSVSMPAGAPIRSVYHYQLTLADKSSWLDYAAVLSAKQLHTEGWLVKCKIGGVDITSSILHGGYKFYRTARILPKSSTTVDLVVSRTSEKKYGSLSIEFGLQPHRNQPIVDRVVLNASNRKKLSH